MTPVGNEAKRLPGNSLAVQAAPMRSAQSAFADWILMSAYVAE